MQDRQADHPATCPTKGKSVVLLCRCAYFDVIDPAIVEEMIAEHSGRAAPADLRIVDDLCALAAHKDPVLAELAAAEDLTVIACFPRAVRSLFDAAGTPLPASTRLVNMRQNVECGGRDAALAGGRKPTAAKAVTASPHSIWRPWFPVIDRDRCVNCRQCLNFCLFGVYAADAEGKVRVVKPESCKTFCPACARLCPSAAIIFPKFADAPINGDEVTPEHLAGQKVQINPRALASGDVHAALRQRSGAQGPAHAGPATPAEALRACPANVVRELSIPAEVVESIRKELAGRPAAPPEPPPKKGDQEI